MLSTIQIVRTPATERLLKLWAKRYTPDLSSLPLDQEPWLYVLLVEASSPEGRANTAAKLQDSLVNLNCQMAGIQARSLYEYIPNVLDLNEARRLTQYSCLVYQKILQIYQQSSVITTSLTEKLRVIAGEKENCSLSMWGMPEIEQLATALEPLLLELQKQHIASKDWRTLGFITTLLNFSNKLFLRQITPIEQVLLRPYFKFVEEQVAIPWERVCAASANHKLGSPALTLVEQMLPVSEEIAHHVYHQLTQLFPYHRSRRGSLSNPDVAHSCIRDLNMFQAYLWLCVLESSLAPVEQELVKLCVMVMQTVEVRWEIIEQWRQLLMDEIISRVKQEQKHLLLPYTQGIQQAFLKERMRLGATLIRNCELFAEAN